MSRPAPDIDIILEILKGILSLQPDSVFVNSLHMQYCERGGLSKKQLEGLYAKATKCNAVSQARLATLQAIILKKPNRYKSQLPAKNETKKDNSTNKIIAEILEKYPSHKRLLFLKAKADHNELITASELSEIEKFRKLLLQ